MSPAESRLRARYQAQLVGKVTIRAAQTAQPWSVPYSPAVQNAHDNLTIPHILGSHVALHIAKSAGKIADVYEWRDHHCFDPFAHAGLRAEHGRTLRAMAADLVTAALRIANLEGFDLEDALCERVAEKNP